VLWKDVVHVVRERYCRLTKEEQECDARPPWRYTEEKEALFEEQTRRKTAGTKTPHWKPEVAIKVVPDTNVYPVTIAANALGLEVPLMTLEGKGRNIYLPALAVHEVGMTSDVFLPLNDTLARLPLHLSLATLSPQRHRLLQQFSQSMDDPTWIGNTHLEPNDVDDMRRLISDTNVPLLAVTLVASMLHLLFEYLTLSSDMKFWHGNERLAGLSVRALYGDLLCQLVVLLFLLESGASLLVTVPALGGIAVAAWKCQRAAGFQITREGWKIRIIAARLRREGKKGTDDYDAESALTLEMDKLATSIIGRIVGPPILLFVLKTLVVDTHPGWYHWAVTSATSVVYAGGFVLMTPQLFLNYKLKSVAHLPWKVLCYRFVNTFIDDLFAFIIKMPTMTRISCFRDDVVFFIYLYQRYIYPVDKTRRADGTES